jgi:hypothetical protein
MVLVKLRILLQGRMMSRDPSERPTASQVHPKRIIAAIIIGSSSSSSSEYMVACDCN